MMFVIMTIGLTSCFWNKDEQQTSQSFKNSPQKVRYHVRPLRAYEGKWVMLNRLGQQCSESYINYDKFKDSYRILLSVSDETVQVEFQGFLYSSNCGDNRRPAELVDRMIAKGRLIEMNEEEKIFRFQITVTDLQRSVGEIKYDYRDHTLADELNMSVYKDNPACNYGEWKPGVYSTARGNFSFVKQCNSYMRGERENITLDNPIFTSWRAKAGGVYYVAMKLIGNDGASLVTSNKFDVQPNNIKNYVRYKEPELNEGVNEEL